VISSKSRLFEEISRIAYAFHWSFDDILDLEHGVRKGFLDEIDRIARQTSAAVR
jgi:hypothetical protein